MHATGLLTGRAVMLHDISKRATRPGRQAAGVLQPCARKDSMLASDDDETMLASLAATAARRHCSSTALHVTGSVESSPGARTYISCVDPAAAAAVSPGTKTFAPDILYNTTQSHTSLARLTVRYFISFSSLTLIFVCHRTVSGLSPARPHPLCVSLESSCRHGARCLAPILCWLVTLAR